MTNAEATPARLAGHAYRQTKAPIGRWFIPGCECGAHLLSWGIDGKTGREIHREHKKQVIKATKDAE